MGIFGDVATAQASGTTQPVASPTGNVYGDVATALNSGTTQQVWTGDGATPYSDVSYHLNDGLQLYTQPLSQPVSQPSVNPTVQYTETTPSPGMLIAVFFMLFIMVIFLALAFTASPGKNGAGVSAISLFGL